MNEEVEFHRQLAENPEDETTANVYADWLEENGRPATAEVIRKHNQEAAHTRKENFDHQTTGVYLHTYHYPASSSIRYTTPVPSLGNDEVNIHIPSLHNPNHTFSWSGWFPRNRSKRLLPQLVKEGLPIRDGNEHQERFNADTTTVPEVHQMSRKPLVVSYRRNSIKRYAVSTIGKVFGQGKSNREVAPAMVGTRLATVLHEIKSGIGKSNPRLTQLTQHALGGSHKSELYTGIRDELFRTKDPRAVALARQYNWHKVGEGLERDKHLRDFVKASAEGTKHQNHHQMYRRFYNGVVHGKNGPDENTRNLFYQHMGNYLKKQTGKEHSYEHIEDSLRRLGETEENHEHLLRNKNIKPQSKFEVPDYPHPAYTGVPKEGKYPRKEQTTPRSKLHVGQYKRPRFRFKLNEQ